MPNLLSPERDQAFNCAVDHHRSGHLEKARQLYRTVLTASPDAAGALNNLALLVPLEEAVPLLRRAVEAKPDYFDAIINLSGALRAGGDANGAEQLYFRALMLAPRTGAGLTRFGRILQQQGRLDEAAEQYEAAAALDGEATDALCQVAAIYAAAGRQAAAVDSLRRALARDPASVKISHNLMIGLKQSGQLREAERYGQHLGSPQPLDIGTAADARRTVLVADALVGNVPLGALLPRGVNTVITWHVEYATDEQERALPPFDVAFNAVGDADVLDASFARLQGFHARRRLLNEPSAVARTRRDRVPTLLRDVPDVVVPAVVRLERSERSAAELLATVTEAGLAFPILVRPIVGHGGAGVQVADTADELAEHCRGDADAFYAIAFHDFRSPDGYFRKYRVVFVDRQPYAYHLAISPRWLVHYFSADMLAEPWKRQEEQRFLENPGAILGPRTMAAIAAIGRRLDLDYGGVDFAVLADGRVLVFEANPTMRVHLDDDIEAFPYKHACVPVIIEAFAAMLDRHAGGRDGLTAHAEDDQA